MYLGATGNVYINPVGDRNDDHSMYAYSGSGEPYVSFSKAPNAGCSRKMQQICMKGVSSCTCGLVCSKYDGEQPFHLPRTS